MTRIVLDTNVLVSSFFGGNPRAVIGLWKTGRVVLCISNAILDEYVAVLQRLGLAGEPEFKEILLLFRDASGIAFTASTPTLRIVKQDPADDKFIECAVALDAAFIVSGDRALTSLRRYAGIRIVTPAEFVRSCSAVE